MQNIPKRPLGANLFVPSNHFPIQKRQKFLRPIIADKRDNLVLEILRYGLRRRQISKGECEFAVEFVKAVELLGDVDIAVRLIFELHKKKLQ